MNSAPRDTMMAWDKLPLPYQSLDGEGRLLAVNRAWQDLTGFTAEEVLGTEYRELVPEEHLDHFYENMRKLMEEGALDGEECYLRRKGGPCATLLIFGHLSKDESGGVKTDCLLVDVSADRAATRKLAGAVEESEIRFRELFEGAADAMILHDGQRVLMANRAARSLFGVPDSTDLARFSVWDFIHPEHVAFAEARLEQIVSTGEPLPPAEIKMLRRDGVAIPAEIKSVLMTMGGRTLLQTTVRDLTARQRTERALKEYRRRLEELLEERTESLERMEHELYAVTAVISRTVEIRDPYTAGHQRRVADLALEIARALGVPPDEISHVRVAALLHDVGKVSVPAEILSKPAILSPVEYNLVKTHAEAGYEIIRSAEIEGPIAELVYQHHERCDGSGYPRGLQGSELLRGAKILMVADVVEAMTSHRPYRASLGVEPALREIDEGAGSRFDADVVAACLAVFAEGFDFSGTYE